MPNLCLIGNSHIAAMLYAWKEMLPLQENVRADFFAQHANTLVEAELSDGPSLLAGSKPFRYFSNDGDLERKPAIDIGSYDAFVIVGLAFGPITVLRTYRKYHFLGLKGFRGQIISRDMFKRAVWREAADGAALHVATLVRNSTDKPVLMVATPLPSEKGYLDLEKPGMKLWRTAVDQGDAALLIKIYAELRSEIEKMGIKLIVQPEDTLASPVSTLQKFADDAVRTASEEIRPETDYMHMNPAYGQTVWRDVLNSLNHSPVRET